MRSVQQAVLAGLVVLLLLGWGWPRPRLPHVVAPSSLTLPQRLPTRVIHLPILEYHRVGITAGLPGLTISPPAFAAEMKWLHGAGYHAITQAQLFGALELGEELPRRPVMITFDDGYRDVLWNAAPLLHRLRMPATAYVITDRVDRGDSSFLSWPELVRLEQLGFTIGSHTVHHVDLLRVSSAQAYAELRTSRLVLERHLRRPVQWLSYPMGGADERVAEIAGAAGYVLGVTERPGVAQPADAPLLLHRFEVLPATGVDGVRALVESASG